jgi:hypothetical protein
VNFLVLDDDTGIRPAGVPGKCFYCGSSVGEFHKSTCVTIVRTVDYEVIGESGERLAIVRTDDPADWSEEMMLFHKNESSWCANNALSFEAVESSDRWRAMQAADEEGGCICSEVQFKVHRAYEEITRSK